MGDVQRDDLDSQAGHAGWGPREPWLRVHEKPQNWGKTIDRQENESRRTAEKIIMDNFPALDPIPVLKTIVTRRPINHRQFDRKGSGTKHPQG